MKHNLAHIFIHIFASKARVQSRYTLFGRDWNGSKQLTFCLENFKPQSWNIKLGKWHETSNKSEITGFYRGENSKITGSFPEVVLCDIDFSDFFDVAFDPNISSIVRFVEDRVLQNYYYLYQLLKQMIHQH